jgi:hypothetical protein
MAIIGAGRLMGKRRSGVQPLRRQPLGPEQGEAHHPHPMEAGMRVMLDPILCTHQRGVRRDTSRKQDGLVGTIQKTHIGGRRTSSHSSHTKANSRRISPLPLAVYLSLFYIASKNSALKLAHPKAFAMLF